MIRHDCHTHSYFSTDSETPMSKMVEQAIKANLSCLTITDHMDYQFPKKYCADFNQPQEKLFRFDEFEYQKEYERIIQCYPDFDFRLGIEIGLKDDAYKENVGISHNSMFDYVIGSVHLVDNLDPYYPELWESLGEEKTILRYFETMIEQLEHLGDIKIDALGHLDYVVRYAPSGTDFYSYENYRETIDAILENIISKNIALEINSSGYKSIQGPNPCKKIIERYAFMGGKLITFGSDAHSPEFIGFHFDDVENIVREIGFDSYCSYKNRKTIVENFSL